MYAFCTFHDYMFGSMLVPYSLCTCTYSPLRVVTYSLFKEMCETNHLKRRKKLLKRTKRIRHHAKPPHLKISTRGIPPDPRVLYTKRGRLQIKPNEQDETDSETARIVEADSADEPDGDVEEMYSGSSEDKPLGGVRTGRLKAHEDDDEGYGGFFNAVGYLIRRMVCMCKLYMYNACLSMSCITMYMYIM